MSKRLWQYVCAILGGLALAFGVSAAMAGCVAPQGRTDLPVVGRSTEADVREMFPREQFTAVRRPDGSFLLFVFLHARPAAPGGGSLVYRFGTDGRLLDRPTIVANN